MNNSRISFISLCLLFVLLWAPLGQYNFLVENWMKVGVYITPCLLFMYFSSTTEEKRLTFLDTKFISVLLLIVYIIHQAEEHWVDLLGNQYAFYDYFNALLLGLLNAENTNTMPLTPESIFVINTSLVWLVGVIAIWRSPEHLFPPLAMAGITLVNAFSHVMAGVFKQSYNPGILTAIVLFIPLAIAFYRAILINIPTAKSQVIASIVWAVLAHILLFGGLLAANWFALFPEIVYFAVLATWSVTPIFLFNLPKPSSQPQT